MKETMFLATPPVGTFKAVLWKELREHLKWSVIGLLGITAGLIFQIESVASELRGHGNSDGIMSIFGVTVFGGALVGLLIGLVQTIPENRGDKWAFLAHRPVSASTLFWGKAVSGTLLYLAATALPLLGALLWLAIPGHIPMPFDWRLAQPGIADLLCGLVFYCAGLLSGMRDARWYASRALGVGAALLCAGLISGIPSFWMAVAVCFAGMLVVGTAAWGTFVAGGRYPLQPPASRTAVGLAVGAGIAVVGFLAINVLSSFVPRPIESQPVIVVTSDGALVQTVRRNGDIEEVLSLDGKPIERYRNAALRRGSLTAAVFSTQLAIDPPATRLRFAGYRNANRLFRRLQPNSVGVPTGGVNWYYIDQLGVIAGYSRQSSEFMGWIGPEGFSPNKSTPRRFDGSLRNQEQYDGYSEPSLLMFDDAVYRLDLEQRRVQKVFEPQPGESLRGANAAHWDGSALLAYGEAARFDVIVTSRRVIVQSPGGGHHLDVPRDPQSSEYGYLSVSRALEAEGMPLFLWFMPSVRANEVRGRPDLVTEYTAAGAIAHRYTLPPFAAREVRIVPQGMVFTAATPLALQAADEILKISDRDYSHFPHILALGLPLLASLVFGTAAFRRAGTYAFSARRRGFWTAMTVLIGPLGYLTMLAVIEWPALERCPACGKKRVVTSERCEHCREPFASPPLDGTEIFEN